MTEGSRATSRSRRSYPNLHNLCVAPLSPRYPLDASAPPSPDEPALRTPCTSYIAGKSAPATPGILSLSQSRSNSRNRSGRHRAKPIYAYDAHLINIDHSMRDTGEIPKAKSTNALHSGVSFAHDLLDSDQRHHVRKATAPLPLRMPLVRHHTSEADDEWWHRAGLTIAGETRDSKGQGWLVRRESSTSLVQDGDDNDDANELAAHGAKRMALMSGEQVDGDAFPNFSPRMSRIGSRIHSRVGSRVPSARTSRRTSRVGSRIDLGMTASSTWPLSSAPHGLDSDDGFVEPDFVEADVESEGDEEEVARLARERGFGLGGWMDRLIGWTLFSVDEDRESSDEEEDDDDEEEEGKENRNQAFHSAFLPENMTREELRLRREVEAKRRKMEREAIVAAAAVRTGLQQHGNGQGHERDETGSASATTGEVQRPHDDVGGWQDAAWLLSVASKALF